MAVTAAPITSMLPWGAPAMSAMPLPVFTMLPAIVLGGEDEQVDSVLADEQDVIGLF